MKKNLFLFVVGCLILFVGTGCSDNDSLEDSPLPGTEKGVKIELTQAEVAVVNSQNSFSLDMYAKLYEGSKIAKNTLLSPFSVYCVLGMLSNGATGETKEEILSAMGLEKYNRSELNEYFGKMISGMPKVDPAVQLETPNSIWYDNSISLKDDFVSMNKEYFGASSFMVDFSASSAVDRINNWCKEATKGKIEKIVDEFSPFTIAALVNAVYFKARWENAFSKKNTSDGLFYQEDGKKVNVPFMHRETTTYYWANELFSSISLPYASGAYQMRLILPNKGVALSDVVNAVKTPGYLESCLKESKLCRVNMSIPKFDIKADLRLEDTLMSMGMYHAFDSNADGFRDMADVPFFISMVKQSACLKVDEEGSEGAAVTIIVGDTDFLVPEKVTFEADRPFLFMITEGGTDVLLFIGSVEAF